MTIRSRLIIAFSLCLALALGSICCIIFFYLSASEERHFHAQAVSQLDRVEESINTFTEPGAMSISYLAGLDLVRISYGNLSSYLETSFPTKLLHQRLTHYEQLVYDEFIRVVRSNNNYKNIYIGNRDGQYTEAPEGGALPGGFDPRLTTWYKEGAASGKKVTYTSPYRSFEGQMVCSILVKVHELDDQFMGVLGVDYSLESITAYLSERKVFDTGYLVTLDRNGGILADGAAPERAGMRAAEVSALWKEVAGSPDGQFTGTDENGRKKYIVTHSIANLGWKLAVVFDHDELMASSYRLLRWLLLCAVLLFCVVSAVGVLLARSIVRPMEELVAASKIISGGEYESSETLRADLNEKLAVRAGGETGELAEALRVVIYTLQQRVDNAQQASRAKSEFMANISHELRTPMNAIIGFTQLLLKTPLNAKQYDYAGKANTAAVSLLRIISDILDFSNIERGALDMEESAFNLRWLLNDTLASFHAGSEDLGIKLILEADPALPELVTGDAARLRQVLVSLLSNSFKFTTSGSITVKAGLLRLEAGKAEVRFEVADTGIGISPEKLGSIFDPFLQADNSSTREYGGAGLGLALVKRLVELMHGRVEMRSEPGKGTSVMFSMVLGLADAAEAHGMGFTMAEPGENHGENAAPVSVPEADATSVAVARHNLQGCRILLVEDNIVNTQVAIELLEEMGLQVSAAAHGGEALTAVDAAFAQGHRPPFDIVLMDLQMPVMDGYQAAQSLLDNPNYKELVIVALTAHALDEDRERCRKLGMRAHVSKPIDVDVLRQTLEHFLLSGPPPPTLL